MARTGWLCMWPESREKNIKLLVFYFVTQPTPSLHIHLPTAIINNVSSPFAHHVLFAILSLFFFFLSLSRPCFLFLCAIFIMILCPVDIAPEVICLVSEVCIGFQHQPDVWIVNDFYVANELIDFCGQYPISACAQKKFYFNIGIGFLFFSCFSCCLCNYQLVKQGKWLV